MVTKTSLEVCRETNLETPWIVLWLELNQVEHALVGAEWATVSKCLIPSVAAFKVRGPDSCSVDLGDDGDQFGSLERRRAASVAGCSAVSLS